MNPALQPLTTNRFYNPKNYDVIVMQLFVFFVSVKKGMGTKLVCNKCHRSIEKSMKFLDSLILSSFSSFLRSREITSRDVFSCKAKS